MLCYFSTSCSENMSYFCQFSFYDVNILTGGHDLFTSVMDASLEVVVETAHCCHLDALQPEGQLSSDAHIWDYLFYASLIIAKVTSGGYFSVITFSYYTFCFSYWVCPVCFCCCLSWLLSLYPGCCFTRCDTN